MLKVYKTKKRGGNKTGDLHNMFKYQENEACVTHTSSRKDNQNTSFLVRETPD